MVLGKLIVALLALLCLTSLSVRAQQPFVTDDTDVPARHKFELQLNNEFDLLQRSAFPAKTQDTALLEFNYGLVKGVEIGVGAPWLRIQSAQFVMPDTASGIGDISFHVKYNFLKERQGSNRPALAVDMTVQMPTGNVSKDLGTGVTEYNMNWIIQKSLSKNTKLRLNGGIVFGGNTANGALGLTSRGLIFTGGGSIVRQFTKKLDLGIELTGDVSSNFNFSGGELQTLVGGNYAIRKNLTFDFGLIVGRFDDSPRAGAQVGLTLGF